MTNEKELKENRPLCELCGEPMPAREEMFKFHGYSCDCPKQPIQSPSPPKVDEGMVEEFFKRFPVTVEEVGENPPFKVYEYFKSEICPNDVRSFLRQYAPQGIKLPEKKVSDIEDIVGEGHDYFVNGWNACLAVVERMNGGDK